MRRLLPAASVTALLIAIIIAAFVIFQIRMMNPGPMDAETIAQMEALDAVKQTLGNPVTVPFLSRIQVDKSEFEYSVTGEVVAKGRRFSYVVTMDRKFNVLDVLVEPVQPGGNRIFKKR